MACIIYAIALIIKVFCAVLSLALSILPIIIKLAFNTVKITFQFIQLVALGLFAFVCKTKEIISDKLTDRTIKARQIEV